MTAVRTLDVSGLPVYEISKRSPIFLGQVLLAVIEGAVFCIMIAVYFYARLSVDLWPPAGVPPLKLTLPSVALIPLLLSAGGSYIASEGAKKDSWLWMFGGLLANLVLAIIFLVFRFAEWNTFNFTWASDIHGSLVWSILFLHTFDVVADLIFTVVLLVILLLGKYGPHQRIGVHVDSVVWYFLVLIWIPLYVTVYWGPYMVAAK